METEPSPPPAIRGVYALADTSLLAGAELIARVEAALRGGVAVVQYRDKSVDSARRLAEAQALRALCTRHGAAFIVNDDVDLALSVGADGVHLGRDDASPALARVRLGPRALIGATCYDRLALAPAALTAGADHVAFGRFFPSSTKPGAIYASLDLLRAARASLRCPIVCIGGIRADNAAPLLAAGADALAVGGALFGPGVDTEAAARALAALWKNP
ncbi:MAG: thiamine phosphate synthase [Immundisolibacter sp.]|uniref:thiamine phosphate synthase n=1 Tax=Immundisolibacter sp. TaxID=1934948 RepID=UPI0019A356D0|nr:thiamine phosphate synthase [Immundisolibacter sp.]MBC7161490.1 thiamine phosphate synthase [Immundisolibacter sp.]